MGPENSGEDRVWVLSEKEVFGGSHMTQDDSFLNTMLQDVLGDVVKPGKEIPSMTVDGSTGQITLSDIGDSSKVVSVPTNSSGLTSVDTAILGSATTSPWYLSSKSAYGHIQVTDRIDEIGDKVQVNEHKIEMAEERILTLERECRDRQERINMLESMINYLMNEHDQMREQLKDMMAGKEYTPLSKDDAPFRDLLDSMGDG